jgi:hypothetical protein
MQLDSNLDASALLDCMGASGNQRCIFSKDGPSLPAEGRLKSPKPPIGKIPRFGLTEESAEYPMEHAELRGKWGKS